MGHHAGHRQHHAETVEHWNLDHHPVCCRHIHSVSNGLSVVDDVAVDETSVLLLPGGTDWDDPKHGGIIRKAGELLSAGAAVCAICGATAALANAGLLDRRPHTSNGAGFLESFCPNYQGQRFYVDAPSVADGNLITAGGTGALLWAKQIIAYLGVFAPDTLDAWYAYFSTGEARHFFSLMQTLPSAGM